MDPLKFYRPYTSDSEYDSDSDGSSISSRTSRTSSVFENEVPNFVQLAQNLLSNQDITGPRIPDISGQVFFSRNRDYSLYNSYDTITENISSSLFLQGASNTLTAKRTQVTSIINLDSQDRDKSVYPQPTNLQLRLPRTYRNINNFQIVQIKLLSAFYYFRRSKQNISIPINEQYRYLDKYGNVITNLADIVDPNFEKTLNIITTNIREGSYNIDTLINELNTQLNVVPVFYDFINGFNDFVPLFASTGDFSVNFNLPGDYYYNSLLNEFIANPTVDQIVSNYFRTRYAGQTSYTINQIKIAYYYPVIKELLLDDNYSGNKIDFTNIDATFLLPGETPYSRCVYYFQGLNDTYVLNVILNNVSILDAYRVSHTFRYALINKYIVSYNTFNNYISIATPSLNTSLVNLLNQQQQLYFNQQLNSNSITLSNYNDLFTQNTLLLAVLNDMYNYLQTNFASQFAIEYNSFTLDYYGNMNNYAYLRNGSNGVVSSNYDINIITNNKAPISNNIITNYQQSNIANWSNLYANPSSNFSTNTNLYFFNNNPFNLQSDSIETYHNIVDNNSNIYCPKLLNYVDTIANINNTSYSVLKFKSNLRQTLQVETLPRPTKYRYQEYNSNYSSQIQDYFNNRYTYEYNQSNVVVSNTNIIINNLPTIGFGISYADSLALWNSSNTSVSGAIPENYYNFIPPLVSNDGNTYRYSIGLTVDAYPLGTNFNAALDMFIYRDAGAFYADVLSNRTESKYNYLFSNSIIPSLSSLTIQFTTYVPSEYYVIVRSQSETPTVVNFTLSPYCVNGTSNTLMSTSLINFNPLADPTQNSNNLLYARSYDSNFLALPNYDNLFQQNPVSNTLFPDISYNDVPIGYDTNGVSTDLTSYIGYAFNQPSSNNVPNSTYRVDPISQYIFRNQSGYNSTTQTYFYANSSNKLFTPQLVSNYIPSTPTHKQYLQVHYYGTHFLSNSKNQPPLENTFTTNSISVFNSNSFTNSLNGYNFDTSGNLTLGNGIYGLSLIPSQGTWDIERYMIKSIFNQNSWTQTNIYNYSSDPNLNIKYLGIFYNSVIYNKELSNISLQNAIAKLNLTSYNVYNSSSLDYGFGSEGGTYYEYRKDDGFRSGTYSYLYGFAENSNTITNDYNNGYTILGFDVNSNIVPFVGLTGSLVPYPFYSDAIASNAYLDGTNTSNGFNLIVPRVKTTPDNTRGPPATYNQTQSQYEQSLPIGTTYQAFSSNISLTNAQIYAFSNISTTTSRIVMDIPGFMMTQDTDFRIYSYSTINASRKFNYIQSLTTDEIFDYNSNITLGAVSANEYEYAFLGLSNGPNYLTDASANKIIINTFNPTTQMLQTKLITNFYSLTLDQLLSITSFTYNNFGGFTNSLIVNIGGINRNLFISVTSSNSVIEFDWAESNVQKIQGATSNTLLGQPDPIDLLNFTTYQHPRENLGRFYVGFNLSNSPTINGVHELYYVDPTIQSNTILPVTKNIVAITNTQFCKITAIQFTPGTYYTQLALTRAPIQDTFYGFKNSAPSSFSQLTTLTPTSLPYDYIQMSVENTNSIPAQVYEMEPGYNGGLWFSDLSGNIYGNRNNSVDGITTKLEYAWQIFYHTQRVVYKNVSKSVNLLSDLSGLQYPEYYHTQLFFYNNTTSFSNDFSNAPTTSPWGNESNYLISDTKFSGYNFNAYATMIPLVSNSDYNYIALRNYSPTEKSQVYVRLSLPNRYDYGYARFTDISNETVLLSTATQHFNPIYANNLSNFNTKFIFATKTFGANIVPNYFGVTLSNVSGFGDFMRFYQFYYGTYTSNVTLLNTINNNVNTSLSNFISNDLQHIIPPTANNRQKFSDPLLFSILWQSQLAKQYDALEDQWGLGWNLGYTKSNTPYDLVQTATSFYKILDDYITLRLNEEFDVNRVDTSGKEKLSATLESTGNTKAYYGKLLLANFGSYAQTMIMNPISFNPPLGRLDKLTFTFYDRTNNVIDNSDCEWNAIVQIVENSDVVQVERDAPILNPR